MSEWSSEYIFKFSFSTFYPTCVEMTHWLTNRCKPWIWESLTSWLKWWFVSSRLIFHVLLTRTSLVFFDRIFPESLRWLLATQQYCRSKWIMGHIAKKNRVNMELDADNILTGNKTLLIFHEIFTDSSSKLFLFLHCSIPPPPQLCFFPNKPDWQGYITFPVWLP